jgi:hypothetical protein
MELTRSSWTDSRLDDLNGHVGELSARVTELSARVTAMDTRLTGRADELGERVDRLGERLDARIDALQHSMIQGFIVMMVAMGSGFIGLAGLIVAKL